MGRDVPLSKTHPGAQDVILEWKVLVDRLAPCIQLSQLRLSVLCDTLDYATAKQIAKPWLGLPILAECAIHLGRTTDSTSYALFERTVLQATSQSSYNLDQVFCFLDLPDEVQIQISSYTDLVSDSVIEWSKLSETNRLDCCKKCTDSLNACCCAVRHSAYTTASCVCWSIPLAIFLINRRFREYSTEICSKNIFKVIWDASSEINVTDYIINVLATLPPAAFPYI